MRTVRLTTLLLFALAHFHSFSQSLEEREKITEEFESRSDIEIELYHINASTKRLDSIQIKSKFLKSKNIDYRIIGFRISGIDKNGVPVFFFKSSKDNIIPSKFKEQLASCSQCQSVKVDRITINWFTGTYTLKNSQTWGIK